jgi:hypothetical protein
MIAFPERDRWRFWDKREFSRMPSRVLWRIGHVKDGLTTFSVAFP